MRVLLTGAAGFIGSHTAEALLEEGWDVVGLDNFDPFYDPALKRQNLLGPAASECFRLVEGDIRDRSVLEEIASGGPIDAIVHLAARAGVRPSLEDPRGYMDTNVCGTAEVLDLARRAEVPRFVFASSSSVYGEREGAPFREDDRVDAPISPYAASKKAAELLCYTYHHNHSIPVTCLRFFTVYGPRQRPEMAIHKFARAIDRGESLTIYGDGTAKRDFTYIDDVVQGVLAAARKCKGYEVYNLGNHRTVELTYLIRLLEQALGRKAEIEHLPAQPGDVPLTCADIERARKDLGYDPAVPIERGIELFVEWFERRRRERGRR